MSRQPKHLPKPSLQEANTNNLAGIESRRHALVCTGATYLSNYEFDNNSENNVSTKEELIKGKEQLDMDDLTASFKEKLMTIAKSDMPDAEKEEVFAQEAERFRATVEQRMIEQFATAAARQTAAPGEPEPSKTGGLVLPDPDPMGQSYRLYRDRTLAPGMKKRKITALEHLENEWRPFINAGVLYLDDLRRLDEDLVLALYRQESNDRLRKGGAWKVHDVVPTRSVRLDRELAELPEKLQDQDVRTAFRLRGLASMRRHRATGTVPEPG